MRILVTGADGFIGKQIYNYLHPRYDEVHGTVFYSEPAERCYSIDLTDPGTLENIPPLQYDVCIHAAGTVDQTLPGRLIRKINSTGTRKILQRIAECGCRHFIHMSSITVYGKRVVGMHRHEQTKRKLRGIATIPYGRAKAKAETFIEESGVPYTILRLPPVLGEKDTALTPAIKKRFTKNDVFTCSLDNKLISVLHVRALPCYIDRLIHAGPCNDAFNTASHHLEWREFLSHYMEAWSELMQDKVPVLQRKSKLTFLLHMRDKDYLLSALFSTFGSHFPTEKLEGVITLDTECSCSEGIREALCGH